jgi:hypothetical protein
MQSLTKQSVRKAEKEGYASLLNDTKWRELCIAFAALEKHPRWRTRDFLTGHLSQWDGEWFHHVGPNYCSIEWLEIDPRDCPLGQIFDILNSIGIPFEDGEYPKIFGYKKSRTTDVSLS